MLERLQNVKEYMGTLNRNPVCCFKNYMETKSVSWPTLVLSLRAVVEGNSFTHLWYLYVLIGIYLVMPVLRAAISRMEEGQLECLLEYFAIIGDCKKFCVN